MALQFDILPTRHYAGFVVVLLWACVPAIAVGIDVQANSPSFAAYSRHLAEQLRAEDGGSGHGVGLALAPSWEFAAVCYSALAAVITVGIVVVACSTVDHRGMAIIVGSITILLCAVGAINGVRETVVCVQWQFEALAIAQSLWAFSSILALVYTAYVTAVRCGLRP